MVADVHRTLKYGGIFMYPATGFYLNVFFHFNLFILGSLHYIWLYLSIQPQRQAASPVRVYAHGLHH